ncbi:ABC transporter permease subunit [Microbacterium sp. P07]|uniref:ABC transporter permease subunit n=1 Tax=Microbacterium sp. P07 TaxID=3366952 RepID=UPI0037464C5A
MTTLTASPGTGARTASPHRVTFPRLLRSEWMKLTSLRSTWWSLAIATVLSVAISMLIAAASADLSPGFPAVTAILSPTQFTMLVAGILGSIAVTGEYSTGMIRSTLAAEPRRGAVLVAKAVVVAALMGVTTIVSYAIAIAMTAGMLSEQIDWAEPTQSLIPLALGVLSMIAFALIGVGFGFIIRNGAGAIAATVGLLFVLPIVVSIFAIMGEAGRWIVDSGEYLPMNAAAALSVPGADDLVGSLVALLVWVAALLAGGWGVLRTRDA